MRAAAVFIPFPSMAEDLIQPGEIAYRLDLTAAQLKIVHTALKSLYDDLGHEERDVKQVVASVLDKLPGRARDPRDRPRSRAWPQRSNLTRRGLRIRARTWRPRSSARASTAARTPSSAGRRSTPSSSPTNSTICSDTCGPIGHPGLVSV